MTLLTVGECLGSMLAYVRDLRTEGPFPIVSCNYDHKFNFLPFNFIILLQFNLFVVLSFISFTLIFD